LKIVGSLTILETIDFHNCQGKKEWKNI